MLQGILVRTAEAAEELAERRLQINGILIKALEERDERTDSLPGSVLALLTTGIGYCLEGGREGGKEGKMTATGRAYVRVMYRATSRLCLEV